MYADVGVAPEGVLEEGREGILVSSASFDSYVSRFVGVGVVASEVRAELAPNDKQVCFIIFWTPRVTTKNIQNTRRTG
jgi:hypothetical protein